MDTQHYDVAIGRVKCRFPYHYAEFVTYWFDKHIFNLFLCGIYNFLGVSTNHWIPPE